MDQPYRIILAHADPDTRDALRAMLEGLGHTVVAMASHQQELVEEGCKGGCDLIITSVELRDGDGIDALLDIAEHAPLPSVVIAKQRQLDRIEKALTDHVMAYLVEPVTEDELRPTIYLVLARFREFEELRGQNESLREALEARKVVERAKGTLMRQHDLSEEEAYRKLQRTASRHRKKLREVAEAILLSEELELSGS